MFDVRFGCLFRSYVGRNVGVGGGNGGLLAETVASCCTCSMLATVSPLVTLSPSFT